MRYRGFHRSCMKRPRACTNGCGRGLCRRACRAPAAGACRSTHGRAWLSRRLRVSPGPERREGAWPWPHFCHSGGWTGCRRLCPGGAGVARPCSGSRDDLIKLLADALNPGLCPAVTGITCLKSPWLFRRAGKVPWHVAHQQRGNPRVVACAPVRRITLEERRATDRKQSAPDLGSVMPSGQTSGVPHQMRRSSAAGPQARS